MLDSVANNTPAGCQQLVGGEEGRRGEWRGLREERGREGVVVVKAFVCG